MLISLYHLINVMCVALIELQAHDKASLLGDTPPERTKS